VHVVIVTHLVPHVVVQTSTIVPLVITENSYKKVPVSMLVLKDTTKKEIYVTNVLTTVPNVPNLDV